MDGRWKQVVVERFGILSAAKQQVHGQLHLHHAPVVAMSFVGSVLHSPFYAGAYVYGQRQSEMDLVDGRPVKRAGRVRPPEECRVFLRDHHQGYLDWEEFEENVRVIRGNNLKIGRDDSVAPIRAGQGLLAGLLRCGRCGRKLHVRYWGKSGTAARYVCKGEYDAGGEACLGFGGSTVDNRFGVELLEILSPLGVAASLLAIASTTAMWARSTALTTPDSRSPPTTT